MPSVITSFRYVGFFAAILCLHLAQIVKAQFIQDFEVIAQRIY